MVETKKTGIENEERAKEYSRIKIYISIANIVLSLALLVMLVMSGLSLFLREWASSIFVHPFGIVLLYFSAFVLISWIIDFPLDLYSSYFLEHKYELSNQNIRAWIWEGCKKKSIALIFGIVLVEVLYIFLRFDSSRWWLWCWGLWILFSIVINKLVPIIIVPLFYTYTPIDDETIRSKIVSLVDGTSLKVKNIYALDLSKNTKKANAAFMGLGNTKRVVLGDTLIDNFSVDEIGVVVAHELGHHVHRHILKNMVTSIGLSFVAFYAAHLVLRASFEPFGYAGIDDIAAFPLLCLVFSVFGIIVMPLQNAYSRAMEREADAYALQRTGNKTAFITTMLKLAEINLSDISPHPLIEFIFYSHPPLKKRIEWAESQDDLE
jgi:STE24 endopeptidase